MSKSYHLGDVGYVYNKYNVLWFSVIVSESENYNLTQGVQDKVQGRHMGVRSICVKG